MNTIVVARDRVALDLLLWRRFGAGGNAMLEATLELNPGLADLGAIIPVGTSVILPEYASAPSENSVPVISLFG